MGFPEAFPEADKAILNDPTPAGSLPENISNGLRACMPDFRKAVGFSVRCRANGAESGEHKWSKEHWNLVIQEWKLYGHRDAGEWESE